MIGERVKTARERLDMSQSELARQAGLTSGYINQIESGIRGNPGTDAIAKLSIALGVSVDYLVHGIIGPLERLALEGIPPHILAELGPLAEDLSEHDWQELVSFARWRAQEYRRQQEAAKRAQDRSGEGAAHQGRKVQAA